MSSLIQRARAAWSAWRTEGREVPAQAAALIQEPPTPAELEATIRRADSILKMMAESEGWKAIWERAAKDKNRSMRDLCHMDPSEFQSARGLQLKGTIIGAEYVLDLTATLIEEGQFAEAKLAKLHRGINATRNEKREALRV